MGRRLRPAARRLSALRVRRADRACWGWIGGSRASSWQTACSSGSVRCSVCGPGDRPAIRDRFPDCGSALRWGVPSLCSLTVNFPRASSPTRQLDRAMSVEKGPRPTRSTTDDLPRSPWLVTCRVFLHQVTRASSPDSARHRAAPPAAQDLRRARTPAATIIKADQPGEQLAAAVGAIGGAVDEQAKDDKRAPDGDDRGQDA